MLPPLPRPLKPTVGPVLTLTSPPPKAFADITNASLPDVPSMMTVSEPTPPSPKKKTLSVFEKLTIVAAVTPTAPRKILIFPASFVAPGVIWKTSLPPTVPSI